MRFPWSKLRTEIVRASHPAVPTKYPVGGSAAKAQVQTHTVGGTPANGQTYDVNIGTKQVRYTATGVDTNTTIATALQALLAATDAPPEHQELTWTNPSAGVVTSTAKRPGRPSTISTAASGTGTFVTATTTANKGPEVWDEPTNWNGGTLPVNGDIIDMSGYEGHFRYNLEGLASVALAAFLKPMNSTGQMGLPEINEDDPSLPYGEYRPRFIKFNVPPTLTEIGQGDGQGSPLVKLDLGQTATATTSTVNVYGTAAPLVQDGRAVALKMTATGTGANHVAVSRGSVGLAMFPGEALGFGTSGTLRVGFQTSQDSDADVLVGSGVTMPDTVTKTGGRMIVASNMTTLNHRGGETVVNGTATLTTGNHDKGTIRWNSSGTVTTWNVGSEATIGWNGDPRPKTVTNCNANINSRGVDDQGVVTFTNGVVFVRGDLKVQGEFDWAFGPNRTIVIS